MKRPLPTVVNFTDNKLTDAQKSIGFYDIPKNYIKTYEDKYKREIIQRKSLAEIMSYIMSSKGDAYKKLGLMQLVTLTGHVEAQAILLDVPWDIYIDIKDAFGPDSKISLFNNAKEATKWIKEETERINAYKMPLPRRLSDPNTIKRSSNLDGFFDPDLLPDIADVY